MNLLESGIGSRLLESAGQIALVLLPFVVFAIVIHFIEQLISRRLSSRFGWHSVMWTGWLGTPIHELSHAAMCVVFRHNIDEMALFEPDMQSGRLGYVRHSYAKRNWYQEFGNFFIGIAPFMGGTLVLVGLLWVFFPDVAKQMLVTDQQSGANVVVESGWQKLIELCRTMVTGIFSIGNLGSWKFWLFLYLSLCVATHMAPSRSDYEGASRAAILLGAMLLIVLVLGAAVPKLGNAVFNWTQEVLTPLVALLALAVVLCIVVTAVVFVITEVTDRIGWTKIRYRTR